MWGTRFPNWMTCATLRNGKMENCLRPVAEVKSELQALKLDTFLFDLGGVLVNDLDLTYDTSIRIFKMLGKRAFTKEEYLANLMPIQNLYKFWIGMRFARYSSLVKARL